MTTLETLTQSLHERPLPSGWGWVKFRDICQQDRRIVEPGSAEATSLLYLSLEHIESGSGRILKVPADSVEDEGRSTTFRFDSRHVLYGKLRPYLNKVAVPQEPGRCTTEMIPLLPVNGIEREFLGWLLRREETVGFAMRDKTGSRMPRADMHSLLSLPVPLPPLPERQRITDVLREQMAAVEKARAAAQARLEAGKALPAAFLRQVFPQPGQPLPDGWRWVKLEEVVDCFTGAWGEDSEFEHSTAVKVVGTSQITNEGLLNANDAPIRYLSQREMLSLCFAGDLLVVKSSGSAANIRSGKTAICPNELSGKIACANFLMRLAPRLQIIEPYLLWRFLNGEDTKAFVRRIAGSSTYPNIKWSSFRNLEISLPPLPDQQRIAEVLREQMAAVEKARAAAEEELNTINTLPAALLRRAFNGEI